MNGSHKPIAAMSGISLLGGIIAYTRTGSIPSIVASFTIGGVMALSSMRIKDNMDYGLEGAAVSSAALAVPTLRRAITIRTPIPTVISLLALGSTAYYTKAVIDERAL